MEVLVPAGRQTRNLLPIVGQTERVSSMQISDILAAESQCTVGEMLHHNRFTPRQRRCVNVN